MSATSFITNANVQRAMADDWHALRAEAVLQKLDSSPLGLTSRQAAERLSRFGPNELVQTARVSPLRILLSQFVDGLRPKGVPVVRHRALNIRIRNKARCGHPSERRGSREPR